MGSWGSTSGLEQAGKGLSGFRGFGSFGVLGFGVSGLRFRGLGFRFWGFGILGSLGFRGFGSGFSSPQPWIIKGNYRWGV